MVNGLVEIHKSDIVHRDLKPENIFINEGKKDQLPTAKIGDFGLARMLTSSNDSPNAQDNRSSMASTL